MEYVQTPNFQNQQIVKTHPRKPPLNIQISPAPNHSSHQQLGRQNIPMYDEEGGDMSPESKKLFMKNRSQTLELGLSKLKPQNKLTKSPTSSRKSHIANVNKSKYESSRQFVDPHYSPETPNVSSSNNTSGKQNNTLSRGNRNNKNMDLTSFNYSISGINAPPSTFQNSSKIVSTGKGSKYSTENLSNQNTLYNNNSTKTANFQIVTHYIENSFRNESTGKLSSDKSKHNPHYAPTFQNSENNSRVK